ncbi:MAG: DUF167 domain-containing protein [bacterium]
MLNVKVITNAKQNKIEKTGESGFKIYITQKPEKGKANEKVLDMLAEHLKIPKSRIKIKLGAKTNKKVIEIE